ncbi:ATP-binding protein [Alkalihalobacillus sp. MEB130]|uniref:ATP-binding protein n=1 Tax=Alkalihalobacillus sp. MEB130 TaxID=2976704 RepID=UPI0028DE13C0|nr:ATP-binding protein [Alkalihalobacillus sp. MEB130]MDT8858846.1 ATP-binding protein [Alkalihalobacillus sp. MEB130]
MNSSANISESELKNEVEKLHSLNQLILDSVAEGIYGIDLEANVIFWNKAAEELTGFSMSDFQENNLHNLIHHTNQQGEHVPLTDCPVYHALISGESLFVEDDIFWKKDGTSFPVEYTIKPMQEQGKHVGTVITFRDMSEKIKTEEMLAEWEKLLVVGQMSAGIAHEIRNPITSLKGFVQLMKESKQLNEEYFDIMDSEFNRIETIIKELLMFSKPQKTSFKQHDIKDLVSQVVLLMEPQAVMKNIRLVTNWQSCESVYISCLDHQIKQVFINLIKNAMEAIESDGEIVLTITTGQKEVTITVKDDGPGISPDHVEKLGQPFYSTKESGTGLGMMVTTNIIKNNHRGSLEVESEVGKGTVFEVRLPLVGGKGS